MSKTGMTKKAQKKEGRKTENFAYIYCAKFE